MIIGIHYSDVTNLLNFNGWFAFLKIRGFFSQKGLEKRTHSKEYWILKELALMDESFGEYVDVDQK